VEYIVIDVILNTVIILELVIRIIAVTPKIFFESWWNIADVLIVLACIITMLLELIQVNKQDRDEVGVELWTFISTHSSTFNNPQHLPPKVCICC